ncbi:MAG: DUF5683 domain-containing protein [Endomicrobiia bacterium]
MLLRTITIFTIIFFVQFVFATYAQSVELNLSAKTPTNSAIHSAIFPGWGQYFNGQKTKGYVLMGSEIVTLTSTILLYNHAEETYKKYEEKGLRNDPLYDEYSKQMDYVYVGIAISVGIWLYSIVDAYLVCDKQLKGQTVSIFRNIEFTVSRNKAKLEYKILF